MGVLTNVVFYFGGSVVLLVLVLWLLATYYLYLVHRRYAHLPSPKTRSFYMGHIPAMAKHQRSGRVMGELFLDWSKECGSLFVVFFLHVPGVVVLKAEDIREVLMNIHVPKAASSYKVVAKPFGERFMGNGLVTTLEYDSWRPRRSLYDPSFTRSYLKSLIPSFNECVDQFFERLKIAVRGERKVYMRKEFGYVTLQIIGKVAFGSDFSQPRSNKALGLKYVQGDGTLNFLLDHTFKGVQICFRQPLYWLFHPILTEGYRETTRAIRKIGQECIMKRYKAIENEEEVPNDILTQIIRVATNERHVDVEDLVDDFATFYVAGQETTALLLTFTLIALNQHPEVKQRVLNEISEVLGERDYVTSEDIDQLQYLEQVFQEVLRLYPPAGGTGRESPSDDFKLSGFTIPKGTRILLTFYVNQRSPEHWEDPEMFDPSRFDPDRGKPSPFIYSPFSVGYRSCIGKVFAMMEAKIIMARLLNSFKIDLEEGYQLKLVQTTTLKPADDVPCTVVPLK